MPPIPVVSAILANARGEILLQLRDDRPDLLFPAHWTLPGGHVEPGEAPEEAIRRELDEEMELTLPLAFWKVYDAPRAGAVVRQYVYTGTLDCPAADVPLHEGAALRFFGQAELGAIPVAFDHRALIDDYYASYQSDHRSQP